MIYNLVKDYFDKKKIVTLILYLITLFYIPLKIIGLPHIYSKFITNIKSTNNLSSKYLIILICSWLFIQFIKVCSYYLHDKIFPPLSSFIRDKIIKIIIKRYKTNYKDLEMGDLITKIIKAPYIIDDIFDIMEDFIFRNLLLILSSFFYLFYYNKLIALVYIVCIVFIILICSAYVKNCEKFVKVQEKVFDSTHEEIEDTLSNLLSIYTSNKINYESNRIGKLNKDVYVTVQDLNRCNMKYQGGFSIIFSIIFIVLNFVALKIYKSKQISYENFVSIVIINYSLLTSFMGIYYYTRRIVNIKGRAKLFFDYLDSLPYSSDNNKLKLKNLKKIEISLNNISFSYDNKKNVLENISFKLKTNDIVAIVGKMGSGKSTLAKLLVRLKNFDSGSILINNTDIKLLEIGNLRNIIDYIPQHPKLFNRSLIDNINYGSNKPLKKQDIFNILDKLGNNSINSKFKNIIDKNVGKNGSNLSGGQRQMVWILRSIIKNSKVVILDEPTSSLDYDSKIQIIQFIKKFSKDKIIIIITHDSELLKYVNRKIEIKNGKINNI